MESEGDGILLIESGMNETRIVNNTFQIPNRKAIRVLSAAKVNISGNRMILGDLELPCKSNTKIYSNLIKVKIIFRNIGNCSGEYIIDQNYWEIEGTQDILNARIIGTSEQFSVRIPGILKSPPKGI